MRSKAISFQQEKSNLGIEFFLLHVLKEWFNPIVTSKAAICIETLNGIQYVTFLTVLSTEKMFGSCQNIL